MTIAIIAAVILLAILAYFIVSNYKAKKAAAKQAAKENHPSNTVQTFLDTKFEEPKATFTQVQGTKNVHLVDTAKGTISSKGPFVTSQTQVGRRNTIANVTPKKALTSAEIEEQKATDRRARIQRERELREEESFARQRRVREQDEYDRRNQQGIYDPSTNSVFFPGVFAGAMIAEDHHNYPELNNEDTSSKQEEQPVQDTSSSETYTGIPSYGDSSSSSSSSDYTGIPAYGGSDDSSSSSSSSYDSGSSYSSSSDSSSSYSSSSDSSSSYDSGSSSSGGSDW